MEGWTVWLRRGLNWYECRTVTSVREAERIAEDHRKQRPTDVLRILRAGRHPEENGESMWN
jgi:hypothetical protein